MMRGFDSIESMNAEEVLVKRKRGSKRFWVSGLIAGGLFFIVGLLIGYFSHHSQVLPTQPAFSSSRLTPEEYIIHHVDKKTLESNLRKYASEPHVAGTQGSLSAAENIRKSWTDSGIDDVHLSSFYVLLSYPNETRPNKIEIVDSASGESVFTSSEMDIALRPEENESVIQPYSAFSPAGDVLEDVVYVNYGRLEDLEYLLEKLHIDLTGKVLIARYGKLHSENKVLNAEMYNASAVILYLDPADVTDGMLKDKETHHLPGSGVQRGSSYNRGDPDTPLYPATDYAYHVDPDKRNLPKIPFQTISYGDALQILGNMTGPAAPSKWQGKLPIAYKIGPGFSNGLWKAKVTVNNFLERRMISNVIGILKGSLEPDSYIILGSHHDSFTFGAEDPGSGSGALSQLVFLFGNLVKSGYRPRRTLVFCSWDAKEFGMTGSTEWVESNVQLLSHRAVAYINMDVAVSGAFTLDVVTSPSLQDVFYKAAKKIPSPDNSFESLYDLWLARPNDDQWKQDEAKLSYGFDAQSDSAAFYERTGVPCANLKFMHNSTQHSDSHFPVYHTRYETFYEYDHYQDPQFRFTISLVQLWGLVANDLANSPLLPLNVTRFSSAVNAFVGSLLNSHQKEWDKQKINYESLKIAAETFVDKSEEFQARLQLEEDLDKSPFRLFSYNDKMMQLERMFLLPEGLPDRPQLKNIVFGPSQYNANDIVFFPGIVDTVTAIQQGIDKWDSLKQQIYIATFHIQSAAASLQEIGV